MMDKLIKKNMENNPATGVLITDYLPVFIVNNKKYKIIKLDPKRIDV